MFPLSPSNRMFQCSSFSSPLRFVLEVFLVFEDVLFSWCGYQWESSAVNIKIFSSLFLFFIMQGVSMIDDTTLESFFLRKSLFHSLSNFTQRVHYKAYFV